MLTGDKFFVRSGYVKATPVKWRRSKCLNNFDDYYGEEDYGYKGHPEKSDALVFIPKTKVIVYGVLWTKEYFKKEWTLQF